MEAENIRISFVKEIEGYLNNKRCLYEAEGRREYLPLVDQALNLIRNMKEVTAIEQRSICNNLTYDRPSEKMYRYAEGEAIECVICLEHVETNHAQVRLSCGHIYHLNCLGSHFNHSGDYKCPSCRIEVDKYVKQPRIWENGPPPTPTQIDTNDIPHPGELDFANFRRGVLQVVNSIIGSSLSLGHPFRNDNAEEDYYDNDDESPSENEDAIYESSDNSDESEDDNEYNQDIDFLSQRTYYSSSNETLPSSVRRTTSRLISRGDSQDNLSPTSQGSTIRARSISRNRPCPDSMSGSAFRRFDSRNELHSSRATQALYERNPNHFERSRFERSRPSSFSTDNTPRSEVNEIPRHASTTSRLRNMYHDDSTDDLMDGESDSSSSSSSEDSDEDQDEDEVMFTGSFNWDASNDMDTSDDDSGSEDEGYRRNFSHRSSSSATSSSDEDEENENDNESVGTASTNNSRSDMNSQWYKPWSWYNNNNDSTISAPDTDVTISSGDDFE